MKFQDLTFTERRDWLRLSRTQNVGPVAFRDLLKRYGSAGAALEALPSLIRRKTVTPPSPRRSKQKWRRARISA